MSDIQNAAIIGAGLAGCYLAQQLTKAGIATTVFEKSRGTGGRLSSCRLGEGSADLGAPYFDATTDEFRDWVKTQPNIVQWCDISSPATPAPTRYTATPRQSALTRALLSDSTLCAATRIASIQQHTDGSKQLISDDQQTYGPFDAVFVCAPAQQAADLLSPAPDFADIASRVQPTMNWVIVIEVEVEDSTEVNHYEAPHLVIARAIKDSAKPGRKASAENRETWMIEADADWSRVHEDADADWVYETLLSAFAAVLARPFNVTGKRTHRWLYSRHINPVIGSLWSKESRIGACGDWLDIGGVEGAWRSAHDLSQRVLARTKAG